MLASTEVLSTGRVEVRRRADYPSDDLGFLQRTHPLRGRAFGQLVYMADSIMQPMCGPGFGMHPHANVEVISYVVDGELTHRDSDGNVGIVPAGGFQRITAGTGILHDESNRTGRPLRMFQIWFAPAENDVAPSYASIGTVARGSPNGFTPVIQPGGKGALDINADASISLGRFEPGEAIEVVVPAGRNAMLYMVEGGALSSEVTLACQDQLRLAGPQQLTLSSQGDSSALLIESAA